MTGGTLLAVAPAIPSDTTAVLGAIALVLLGVLGLVLRSIVTGKLVPKESVDRFVADRDAQITAKDVLIESMRILSVEQSKVIATQADSLKDFSDATKLQNRLADALHESVTNPAAGRAV